MNWRLAVCPKSVTSWCSRCPATTSVERTLPTYHHGVHVSRHCFGRGLCWIRRTPPFPRKAVTTPALLQDLPEKKHLPCIDIPPSTDVACNAKRPILSSLVENASVSSFNFGASGDEGNFAAIKATTFQANASGNPLGTAVSTAAILSCDVHNVKVSVNNHSDALQHSSAIVPRVIAISSDGAPSVGPAAVHGSLENTTGFALSSLCICYL
ncbi:hypothetical protein L7F22_058961 [Adiantum nelumboides]|nr:hypothetical protein [Adiantum nelumboides]